MWPPTWQSWLGFGGEESAPLGARLGAPFLLTQGLRWLGEVCHAFLDVPGPSIRSPHPSLVDRSSLGVFPVGPGKRLLRNVPSVLCSRTSSVQPTWHHYCGQRPASAGHRWPHSDTGVLDDTRPTVPKGLLCLRR